jgi:hypothetical protein
MTLSISDQPSQWHRIAKRHSLLSDATIDPFPHRTHRTASLIDHHIVRDRAHDGPVANDGRRSTAPYLPYPPPPPPPPPPIGPRATYPFPDPRYPAPGVHPEQFHDPRKRSMQDMAGPDMEEEDSSPTSTGQVEGGNQFCLCQPEPKIPRPRNGEDPCRSVNAMSLTMSPSLHSLSPASTSRSGSSQPRLTKSGHIQNHW